MKKRQFRVNLVLKQVLEMLLISCHTGVQQSTLSVDRLINDMLLQTGPHSNLAPLRISNIECQCAADVLLRNAPVLVVH